MMKHPGYTPASELSRKELVVVIFTAARCGPCKSLKPSLTALAADYGFAYYEFDVADFDADELFTLGVRNVPNVRVLRDGEVMAQFVGARTKAQVESWLTDLRVISRGLSFE